MGWFKDFFFGDMDEEIDTYEDTSSRKVEKKTKQQGARSSSAKIKCNSN